jgi:hypothetical protein
MCLDHGNYLIFTMYHKKFATVVIYILNTVLFLLDLGVYLAPHAIISRYSHLSVSGTGQSRHRFTV